MKPTGKANEMGSEYRIQLPTTDTESGAVYLTEALCLALVEINQSKTEFNVPYGAQAEDLCRQFSQHPDSSKVRRWIALCGCAPSEFGVIFWMSCCAKLEWAERPRRTTAAHKDLYQNIGKHCRILSTLFAATGSRYFRGGGWGLQSPAVLDLLTTEEMERVEECLGDPASPDGRDDHLKWLLPTVDELLERLGSAANRLAEAGPAHTQPNKQGAERGYFVRRMHQLMMQRYGTCSDEILAVLATVFLDNPTDRELVAKLIG